MPMQKFEPSDEQREAIAVLASAGRLTLEEIARATVNGRTGRSISVKTLRRACKNELQDTPYKKKILDAFWKKIDAGNEKLIEFGMKYIVGFDANAANRTTIVNNNVNWDFTRAVTFCEPDPSTNPALREDPSERPPQSWQDPPRQLPHHSGPTISSDDPCFIRPLAEEIQPPADAPAPSPPPELRDIPADALFDPRFDWQGHKVETGAGPTETRWWKKRLTGQLKRGPIMGVKRHKGFP